MSSSTINTRIEEIKSWLITLSSDFVLESLQYLQSDASARKYLRVKQNNESLVIMDTQPGDELERFLNIDDILRKSGLNAPKIIAKDLSKGLLLMNDLGSKTYFSEFKKGNPDYTNKLYLDSIVALAKLQQIKPTDQQYKFSVMDDEYIRDRLKVFETWYLQKHLGLELDSRIKLILERMQDLFSEVFSSQKQVLVHVDYHCRNLMAVEVNNPGIIDFQDAMIGPASYDLVSLLQDAYIYMPSNEVEAWIKTFSSIGTEVSLREFELTGLQRHVKNLGVFARLHHRDQKSNYLNDMPMLKKYITETCSRYDDLSWLLDFFTEVVDLAQSNPNEWQSITQ